MSEAGRKNEVLPLALTFVVERAISESKPLFIEHGDKDDYTLLKDQIERGSQGRIILNETAAKILHQLYTEYGYETYLREQGNDGNARILHESISRGLVGEESTHPTNEPLKQNA